jgi:hypothetical protein
MARTKITVTRLERAEMRKALQDLRKEGVDKISATKGLFMEVRWWLAVAETAALKEPVRFGGLGSSNPNVRKRLLHAAIEGRLPTVQWMRANGIGRITQKERNNLDQIGLETVEAVELDSFLKIIALLPSDLPARFMWDLSPKHTQILTKGKILRVVLRQAYKDKLQAHIMGHCPLISDLHRLVASYANPTFDDIWIDTGDAPPMSRTV